MYIRTQKVNKYWAKYSCLPGEKKNALQFISYQQNEISFDIFRPMTI
jgi:hypothetical protein